MLVVDGMLADVGAVYRAQLITAAAVLVAAFGGLLIRTQPARAAESAVRSVTHSGTEAPLGPYLVAWGSGLAACSHILLAMRYAAIVPGTWGLMLLATLVFLAAVVRVGVLVGRRAQVADRQPLLNDRPLVATTFAWIMLVAVGSGVV